MDMTEYEHRQDGDKLKSRSRLGESAQPGAQPVLRIWWQLPEIKERPSYSWVDGNWAKGTGRERLEGVSAWKNCICWRLHSQLGLEHKIKEWGTAKETEEWALFWGTLSLKYQEDTQIEMSSGQWVQRLGTRIWVSRQRLDQRVQIWESANMAIRTVRMNKTIRECLNRENSWKWSPR